MHTGHFCESTDRTLNTRRYLQPAAVHLPHMPLPRISPGGFRESESPRGVRRRSHGPSLSLTSYKALGESFLSLAFRVLVYTVMGPESDF